MSQARPGLGLTAATDAVEERLGPNSSPISRLLPGAHQGLPFFWCCQRPLAALRAQGRENRPAEALPSAHLDQESYPGPFLPVERQVDEGRDAHQVEASGRDVTARDSDRLDGLVDGASPDRMNLDPALTPDDSGDSPGYQVRFGRGTNFEHLLGRPSLTRHCQNPRQV